MDRQKYSFIREIPFYDPRSPVTYAQDSMFKALFSILPVNCILSEKLITRQARP